MESYPDILQEDKPYIDNDHIPELDIELSFDGSKKNEEDEEENEN